MLIDSQDLVQFFFHQLNLLRKNPPQFGKLLHKRLTLFKDDFTYERGDLASILYKTEQGKKAVEQAIQVLQCTENLPPLTIDYGLCEIAYQISLHMCKQARIDDPSYYNKEIKQAIQKSDCIIQDLDLAIQYGFRKDYQILPTILVDDGNPSRTRRHTLLNPLSRFVGIAVQQHSEYDFIVLMLFTEKVMHKINEHDQHPSSFCSLI